MVTDQLVQLERQGDIAIVTIASPETLNALSTGVLAAFGDALDQLAPDAALRAVVVTGSGERAFCAGANLQERVGMSGEERFAHTLAIEALFDRIEAFPAPTIAAIRGFALAGGSELAIACDLRVAADDATFGFPEVKVGIFPGAGGPLRLPGLVGTGRARDLLLTGRRIDAHEALRMGMVDRVAPAGQELAAALRLAGEIAANAPLAIRAMKRAMLAAEGRSAQDRADLIRAERATLDGTADYEEGLAAFRERRRPNFTGG